MIQKPKVVSRTVGVLRNPDPKFVSIVTHGANQTPFSSVKHAHLIKGENPMPIAKRTTKSTAKKGAGDTTGVLKLTFKKSEFAKKADVETWLTENNWEGYTITAKGDEYIATSTARKEADFSSLSNVEVADGIEAVVGKLVVEKDAEGDDPDEENEDDAEEGDEGEEDENEEEEGEDDDAEETSKSDEEKEPAVKLDYWNMYESNGTTVQDVLKDGMSDGVPPGAGEIMAATNYAIGNVLGSNDDKATKRTKLASIGAEMSALIANVYDVFEEATTGEGVAKSENVTKFVAEFNEFVTAAKADDKTDNATGDKAKDKSKDKAKKVLQTPAKKNDDAEDDKSNGLDAEALAGLIGAAVTKATDGISKALDGLSKKVDNAVKASESATKVAGEAAKAVQEIGSQTLTKRKSAGQDEPQTKKKGPSEAEIAKKAEATESIRSYIGL